MRSETIDQMPAGREMDALVAERILGCKVKWLIPAGHPAGWSRCDCNESRPHNDQDDDELSAYSTDIRAAWKIVEEMPILTLSRVSKFDGSIVWQALSKRCNYAGSLHVIEKDCCIFGEADTASLAVCRAALAAKGML